MTACIDSLLSVTATFDVAVLDQWGVLHDGVTPYPQTNQTLRALNDAGKAVVVLSNSGKRADLNQKRIADVGVSVDVIAHVMTSGEAVWLDLTRPPSPSASRLLLPLCAAANDAATWLGEATNLSFTQDVTAADALLLMGLPDNSPADMHDALFEKALARDLPCLCSNPDKLGIRGDGMVLSPGQLADRYEKMGGTVHWYGKPYPAVYDAVKRLFPEVPPERFLMVGDSLEHDIAGGNRAGFQTAFIRGGIHAQAFSPGAGLKATLDELVRQHANAHPTYSLSLLN